MVKQSKAIGFLIIALVYVVAAAVGFWVFAALPDLTVFWRILVADLGATVVVYLAGVAFGNSSVYDPYWSVAPIVILIGLAAYYHQLSWGVILLLLAVCYWGIRLTANWAYTFKGLASEDWRYVGYRQGYPRLFQLINFFGIHLFPTLVVYLCLLPGVVFIQDNACLVCSTAASVVNGGTLGILTVVGFLICVGAATLQLVADWQMHRFQRQNAKMEKSAHPADAAIAAAGSEASSSGHTSAERSDGATGSDNARLGSAELSDGAASNTHRPLIRTGLWKHARHPNYLGEILMWWGVYIILLSADPASWILGFGALANTLMFLFISIPMADKNNRA
ncbi:MAG: DUF1295 domain-containing protein, partial [Coriobacteriia bacterium]|nr:DUF1295 domain-containing protein [Coriobacteriia bacterium]